MFLEVSKNKQNGRHFKTEISLNPVMLEFHRKYKAGDDAMPTEVSDFKSDYEPKQSKVEIPDDGLL